MPYEHPKHPDRHVLYPGDFPASSETVAEIERLQRAQFDAEMKERHLNQAFEFARSERQELAQRRMSGPLAHGYRREDGPLFPREEKMERDYQIAERAIRCGLPDSSEEMPAVAVAGGFPARFE
jgi:hypothetical protein